MRRVRFVLALGIFSAALGIIWVLPPKEISCEEKKMNNDLKIDNPQQSPAYIPPGAPAERLVIDPISWRIEQ